MLHRDSDFALSFLHPSASMVSPTVRQKYSRTQHITTQQITTHHTTTQHPPNTTQKSTTHRTTQQHTTPQRSTSKAHTPWRCCQNTNTVSMVFVESDCCSLYLRHPAEPATRVQASETQQRQHSTRQQVATTRQPTTSCAAGHHTLALPPTHTRHKLTACLGSLGRWLAGTWCCCPSAAPAPPAAATSCHTLGSATHTPAWTQSS